MRRPKSLTRWVIGLVLAVTVGAIAAWASDRDRKAPARGRVSVEPTAFRQAGRMSLEGGVGWINTGGPIRLDELKGKIVLLDFWTYCCINCHHVLPDLAKLEQKYKNELVVIGVHTPKFFAERDIENIRQKVREYQIKHPVINDADQVLWNRFGVNSWPTLALVDVDGTYLGQLSGEGHYAVLDRVIGGLVEKHRAKGDLNETPIKFFPEIEKPDNTPLLYPGKVLADKAGDRLFIADTGHNRIVQTNLKGEHPVVIGNGQSGLVDGDFTKAEFNRPQGICLVDGETLYVADTENHALRAIDLTSKTVTTVAGNGEQSHRRTGSGPGQTTGLNSPWDVIQVPKTKMLMIAMAGPHQIWRFDMETHTVGVWAGSGIENIKDGPLSDAEFAQPSGLATDGTYLYVADSEVSGVRMVNLTGKNHHDGHPPVSTIVGVGLFGFADVDGTGDVVRLQHCLGLAYGGGKLYIADTYNNKIKVCNPKTKTVKTLLGSPQAEPGDTDDPPRFYQPGGLSVAGTVLYVADTNNQKIRKVDLVTDKVVTLDLEGLQPPKPPHRVPTFPNAKVTNATKAQVEPGKAITLEVAIPLASGFKLNADAPMPYLIEIPKSNDLLSPDFPKGGQKVERPSTTVEIEVPLAKTPDEGETIEV